MATRLPLVLVGGQAQQLQPGDGLPLFGAAAQGDVPLSGGGTVNFLRADGAWASPGASPSSDLALNKHIIASNFTLTAGYGSTIPRYLEISAGITVELGADADLEIG
jgi:hypothetical protein